jgi:predicted DNA-binding transcriptional regulator AlpA
MVAPPSRSSEQLPQILDELRQLHCQLPPRSARWRTQQGKVFLSALAAAADQYQARRCAEALGISTATVYQMLDRKLPTNAKAWPSQEDLRPLVQAWRMLEAVQKRGDTVRRNSKEFWQIHLALMDLLKQYELREVAAAIKTESRKLARFAQPPLQNPLN